MPLTSLYIFEKSIYGEPLQDISIPPATEESNPINTPATDGVVGFIPVPVHEIGPHVIALVVRVELFNVREGEALPLT